MQKEWFEMSTQDYSAMLSKGYCRAASPKVADVAGHRYHLYGASFVD
jgi:hypothetical protein